MEQKDQNSPGCKKCLSRDMADQKEFFHSLREYIANLDEDIKTPAASYEERLSVCKQCELRLDGMCHSYGCYVESRAAVGERSCPWK